MRKRVLPVIVIVMALIAVGCGSDNRQPGEASVKPTPVAPPSAVEQAKPSSVAPVEPPASATPASIKPKSASAHRARSVARAPAQVAPVAVEDSRAVKLANEILNLPLQERLDWSKQEFAKRGIGNVRDDK